jgi:hypothetical protein
MAIKSYTDIEQSRKLAEILPLESADMYWKNGVSNKYIQCLTPFVIDDYRSNVNYDYDIPCWSLAALFGVLPFIDFTTPQLIGTPKALYRCMYNDDLKSHAYDNPVDACYEMILKLHELNLL